MAQTHKRVAIIGAGMAGLACATRLVRVGHAVQMFDKARGPGGRMSTRRLDTPIGEAGFDHGAQYFTALGPDFLARVERWAAAGIAAPWPAAGPEAWVGVPGMNAPVRALASEQAVTWNHPVGALVAEGQGWCLDGGQGRSLPFDGVVVAVPAEQAAVLLAPHDPALAAKAAGSRTRPCWTVMAAFDRPLPFEADVLRDSGPLAWAARNSSKPGRADLETWVLQASPDWSQAHIEDPAEAVCEALLDVLRHRAGQDLPRPVALQAHRWRFARSAGGTDRALWSPSTGLGCCGDWLIGPRVESAWDSGVALADQLLADPSFARD
ncbi:MAG: NAD(P)/FAD-dependent oxidoreductase [Brevundimonas sp.]